MCQSNRLPCVIRTSCMSTKYGGQDDQCLDQTCGLGLFCASQIMLKPEKQEQCCAGHHLRRHSAYLLSSHNKCIAQRCKKKKKI